jgi:hypothetical protein
MGIRGKYDELCRPVIDGCPCLSDEGEVGLTQSIHVAEETESETLGS